MEDREKRPETQGSIKTLESKVSEARPRCDAVIYEIIKKRLDQVKSLTIAQLKMLLQKHLQVPMTILKKEYDIFEDALLNVDATETANNM
jgi:hypothetical protein